MSSASLPAVSKGWRARGHVVGWPALGALLLAVLVLIALLGPFAGLPDPGRQALGDRLAPPLTTSADGTLHLLGTDQLGRDVLSRVVHGARVSLAVASAVLLLGGLSGSLLGMIVGYRGGRLESVLMRLADFQMAFPPLLLAIFLLYVVGASLFNLVAFLVLLTWVGFARLARGQTLALRQQLFVEAAIALGCSEQRILWRHLLPHLVPVLLVAGVFEFASLLLAEASLSFLGLGVQPPEASWGLMLAQGNAFVTSGAWWLVAAPGLAMFLTTLAARGASLWLQQLLRLSSHP
jgi:peptide/nickel transport system permease protein